MSRDRAAYMREYRAKRKSDAETIEELGTYAGMQVLDHRDHDDADRALWAENERLEAEVARLKRELAARPTTCDCVRYPDEHAPGCPLRAERTIRADPSFVRFNPAPKPGKHQ